MNKKEYIEGINRNLDWISEVMNDIRMYRDEERPDWIIRLSNRMANYVLQIQDYADSWQFDKTHKIKMEG